MLVRLGYEVEMMESGLAPMSSSAAPRASGRSPFDLVIMDMVLGEVHDGLQIIEQIHRLFPAQKVIVASGHAPTERAELALKKEHHLAGQTLWHGDAGRDRATGPARRRPA